MTGNSFFLLALVVIIGASLWMVRSYKGIQNTQTQLVERVEQIQQRRPASAPVVVTAAPDNKAVAATKARLRSEALNLQQQLTEENRKLEQQRQALESLQARQQENAQAPNPDSYANELRESNLQLQDFMMELNSYDRLSQDINRRADEILKAQNSQMQAIRDQLDDNIRIQQQAIQQTREQLNYWQTNFNDITARQNELSVLNDLLSQQEQQLVLMQNEKLLLSPQALEAPSQVQADREQALAEINSNRQDLQNEIMGMRSQIQNLQEDIYQSTISETSLRRQILQTQRAYEQQQQQVRKLESSLLEKNAELNALE
nr:hypothetical protein HAGR004_06380 [Bdellovibrio sp. HAGR004]